MTEHMERPSARSKALSRLFHRLRKCQIEVRGNIMDERTKKFSRIKWVARKVLDELLQYLGQVILAQLKCHELTDANLPRDSPKVLDKTLKTSDWEGQLTRHS